MNTEKMLGSIISLEEIQTSKKGTMFSNGVFETLPITDEFGDIIKTSQKYPFTVYNENCKKVTIGVENTAIFNVNSFTFGDSNTNLGISLTLRKIK